MNRVLTHIKWHLYGLDRLVPDDLKNKITSAVAAAEIGTDGELRVLIERALSLAEIFSGRDARAIAVDRFSRLRVWDTEKNTGVLLYVLMADKAVEVVADREIAKLVPHEAWDKLCLEFENNIKVSVGAGLLEMIRKIGEIFRKRLPKTALSSDELVDAPSIR